MNLLTKTYLGDAVYLALDEFGNVVLTTEDGIQATNTIVLEPEVCVALCNYIEGLREFLKNGKRA
jgi:hypothetical protein